MSKQVTIAIIGRGKVGSSFALRIAKMKPQYKLFAHLPARKKSFSELQSGGGPEVIFICSKDDEIVNIGKKILDASGKNLKLLVHCSGSRESTVLPVRRNVARLTLHPMQTFAKGDAGLLQEIYYMASTKDEFARKWAKKFVGEIGGAGIIEVKGKDLPLYHTLVVFASNFTTLLGGSVEILSESLRIPKSTMKKAIEPLMQTSLHNVLLDDAANVLTGPLARKDYSTILKHRIALRSQTPAMRKIYEGFVLLASEII